MSISVAPGWEASLLRSLSCFPTNSDASNHLYTWVVRGTVRIKCLAQEHNTMSLARARIQTILQLVSVTPTLSQSTFAKS